MFSCSCCLAAHETVPFVNQMHEAVLFLANENLFILFCRFFQPLELNVLWLSLFSFFCFSFVLVYAHVHDTRSFIGCWLFLTTQGALDSIESTDVVCFRFVPSDPCDSISLYFFLCVWLLLFNYFYSVFTLPNMHPKVHECLCHAPDRIPM